MRGVGLLLLALLATASALSVERCEVRNIDIEERGMQIPLAIFHCYTDADLYVKTPVNASLAPILLTSTAREVKDHLSGTSDTTNGKLNFAGDWFPCPCRTAEQMPHLFPLLSSKPDAILILLMIGAMGRGAHAPPPCVFATERPPCTASAL
jgi:hypothetical protein